MKKSANKHICIILTVLLLFGSAPIAKFTQASAYDTYTLTAQQSNNHYWLQSPAAYTVTFDEATNTFTYSENGLVFTYTPNGGSDYRGAFKADENYRDTPDFIYTPNSSAVFNGAVNVTANPNALSSADIQTKKENFLKNLLRPLPAKSGYLLKDNFSHQYYSLYFDLSTMVGKDAEVYYDAQSQIFTFYITENVNAAINILYVFTYDISNGDLYDGIYDVYYPNTYSSDYRLRLNDDNVSYSIRLAQSILRGPVIESNDGIMTLDESTQNYWLAIYYEQDNSIEYRYNSQTNTVSLFATGEIWSISYTGLFGTYYMQTEGFTFAPSFLQCLNTNGITLSNDEISEAEEIISEEVYGYINPPVPDCEPTDLVIGTTSCTNWSVTGSLVSDLNPYFFGKCYYNSVTNSNYILLKMMKGGSGDNLRECFYFAGAEVGTERYGRLFNYNSTKLSINPPTGHTFDQMVETQDYLAQPATCTHRPMYYYSCTCGETGTNTFESQSVAPLGHEFLNTIAENVTIIQESSCTTQGSMTVKCTRCDATETQPIDLIPHSTVTVNANAATCAQDGYTGDLYCTECESIVENGQTIDRSTIDHSFGDWTVTIVPTIRFEGQEERVCTVCGHSETRPIDRLDGNEETEAQTGSSFVFDDDAYGGADVVFTVEQTAQDECYYRIPGIYSVFNITSWVNGIATQPNTPVLVTIPIPSNITNPSSITVYHINGLTGEQEQLDDARTYEAEGVWYVEFFANSFSDFIIADETVACMHNYVCSTTPASCTQEGEKVFTCVICDDSYCEKLAVTTHADNDKNGKCDSCGKVMCTCSCHQTGFTSFIWKIRCFFYKLFNMDNERVCQCGAYHW